MAGRDRIPGIAKVNSVRPDRAGGLRCRHSTLLLFSRERAQPLLQDGRRCLSGAVVRGKQLTAMDVAYGRRTSVSPTHVNPAIKGTKHRYRCLAFMHDPSYYRSQAERARRLDPFYRGEYRCADRPARYCRGVGYSGPHAAKALSRFPRHFADALSAPGTVSEGA